MSERHRKSQGVPSLCRVESVSFLTPRRLSHKSPTSRFLVVGHEWSDACWFHNLAVKHPESVRIEPRLLMKLNTRTTVARGVYINIYISLSPSFLGCPCDSTCRKHISNESNEEEERVESDSLLLARSVKRGDSDQRTVAALRALAPIDTLRFSIDSLFYNRRDIVEGNVFLERAHEELAPLNLSKGSIHRFLVESSSEIE